VDTSEFAVAVAASIGFLAGLGTRAVDAGVVAMLLAGGLLAAPVAAWLVRLVHHRLLGASVGGLIVLSNLRVVLGVAGVPGAGRAAAYVAVTAAWLSGVVAAARSVRRDRVLASAPGA
jgi:hypothetical protein